MSRFASQLGFWISVFLVCLGTVYMVILAGVSSSSKLVEMEPASPVALQAGIDTFFTAIGLVILMACVVEYPAPEKKVLAVTVLAFTALFATVVSINRFTQLTVIRQSFLLVDTADLNRFLPYGSRSVFFPLEMLGQGGFLGLATLFAAPVFTQGGLACWGLVCFTTYGILGITSVLGYAFGSPIVMVGFLAWGPVLRAAIILLGVLFWQNYNVAPKDVKGSQSSAIRT